MRKTIIAGNWKMNKTRSEARPLIEALLKGTASQSGLPEIVVCPPFTALETTANLIAGSPIKLGAQNMDYRENGAFTGEISAPMLIDAGATYVIIGHSERRQYFGETNKTVNERVKAALKHKLIPIMCVGETLEEREANLTDSVVRRQTAEGLVEFDAEQLKPLVIAYEPVWAIGTGKVCESQEANRVIKIIREEVARLHPGPLAENVPILYGGSVNPGNVAEQLAQSDIDGSLVGGASLKADDFLVIVKAGQNRTNLSATRA